MRLRCRGSKTAFRFFFFALESLEFRKRVELKPEEERDRKRPQHDRCKVFAQDLHQLDLNSMYMPTSHTASEPVAFVRPHGNVNVPLTRRSSRENVNQRIPHSRAASAKPSLMRCQCARVIFIVTEATSVFARPVKSSTPCGFA